MRVFHPPSIIAKVSNECAFNVPRYLSPLALLPCAYLPQSRATASSILRLRILQFNQLPDEALHHVLKAVELDA